MQIKIRHEEKQPQTSSSPSLSPSSSCYDGSKIATLQVKCSANINNKISGSSSTNNITTINSNSIINTTTGTGSPLISCYQQQQQQQPRKLFLLFIVVFIATLTASFDVTNCAQIPTRFFYDADTVDAGDDGGNDDGAIMSSKQTDEGGQGGADNSGRVKHQALLEKQQTYRDAEYSDELSNTNFHLLQNDMNTDAMPMDFYRELNNITDLNDFIKHFVELETSDPQLGFQDNFSRSVERAAAVIPKRANCIPENTIVPLIPLDTTYNPNVIYFPECTRVKRCSGCCGSSLISCQPTETETINFQVTKYTRQSSPGSTHVGQLRPSGKEIIVIEQHTQCTCDCRIKANDCNAYQLYRKDLCRCECKNHDARDKCSSQDHKIWEESSCRCVCRDNQACTTGTVFDENQCQCVDQPSKISGSSSNGFKEASLNDRKRFIIKAVPVEEDNSTIYSFS